jgi:hypothetical protein
MPPELLGCDSRQAHGYNPPRWPDPAYPQQLHLDILVDDLAKAEEATLALDATPVPGNGKTSRVLPDPAGKPFCLRLEVPVSRSGAVAYRYGHDTIG